MYGIQDVGEKNFTIMLCWLKLNAKLKWNLYIAKTTTQATEEEIGNRTDPRKEPPKKVRRGFWGDKLEEERAK